MRADEIRRGPLTGPPSAKRPPLGLALNGQGMTDDTADTQRLQGENKDMLLANTFLEIVAAGTFMGAAERLGLSQAAVSMRVQALEVQVGCALFTRGRGGARLTPGGHIFHRCATTMKQAWNQTLLELALPQGYEGRVRLGGHYSLWRNFLMRWTIWMRENAPAFAVHADAHSDEMLMRLLGDGTLDIGVTFAPHQLADCVVERLFAEELVLVSADRASRGVADASYFFIDWGPEFRKFHFANYSETARPGVQSNLGAFAVEFVLRGGGSAYLPMPVVEPYLGQGQLHLLEHAPRFETPIYAVYREQGTTDAVHKALDGLRALART